MRVYIRDTEVAPEDAPSLPPPRETTGTLIERDRRETMRGKRKRKHRGVVRVNPIAKDLGTHKYHQRIIRDRTKHDRKRLLKVTEVD